MQSAAYQGSFRLKHGPGLQVETIVLPRLCAEPDCVVTAYPNARAKSWRCNTLREQRGKRKRERVRVEGKFVASCVSQHVPLFISANSTPDRLNSIENLHIRLDIFTKVAKLWKDRCRGTTRSPPLVGAMIILVLRLFVVAVFVPLIKRIYLKLWLLCFFFSFPFFFLFFFWNKLT